MTHEDYLSFHDELFKAPNWPYYINDEDLAKEFHSELTARISTLKITYHGWLSGQAICVTDCARSKLAEFLKKSVFNQQLEIDSYKAAIDEIEDSFAASGRRLE